MEILKEYTFLSTTDKVIYLEYLCRMIEPFVMKWASEELVDIYQFFCKDGKKEKKLTRRLIEQYFQKNYSEQHLEEILDSVDNKNFERYIEYQCLNMLSSYYIEEKKTAGNIVISVLEIMSKKVDDFLYENKKKQSDMTELSEILNVMLQEKVEDITSEYMKKAIIAFENKRIEEMDVLLCCYIEKIYAILDLDK